MKLLVRKFVDLKIALKELEPFIRDGRQVQNGKPFRNFGRMLPREAIANWLLCATANAIDGRQLTFASTDDPIGGDGIIVDQMTDEDFPTEHVMVPVQQSGDAEALILKAIDHKRNKGADAYASGKTLVVFLNAGAGHFFPNRLARALPTPLRFASVWVISLQRVDQDGAYIYGVTLLDVANGDAPALLVRISSTFDAWEVTRVQ
ncbi:hypothetical protein JJB98_10065 [Bradyrhizobium diazoefficiens]|nr:hypothetical protein [Bradyrhizobium diazoefficiens]QQO20235.1 hypothetical protein JJB98_10065 [Bradyrhizobium diazoefficiens]